LVTDVVGYYIFSISKGHAVQKEQHGLLIFEARNNILSHNISNQLPACTMQRHRRAKYEVLLIVTGRIFER